MGVSKIIRNCMCRIGNSYWNDEQINLNGNIKNHQKCMCRIGNSYWNDEQIKCVKN